MKLTAIVTKGHNCFGAHIKEFNGCFSAGRTLTELKLDMDQAIDLHADYLIEMGEKPINTNNVEIEWKYG